MNALPIIGIILMVVFFLGLIAFVIIVSMYGRGYAKNKWAKVNYWKDGDQYKARVEFASDLTGVSAIHIHREKDGGVGPIIAWLATSQTWHDGAMQRITQKNAPCCNSVNGCTIQANVGTLDVSQAAGKIVQLDIPFKGLPDACNATDMLKKRKEYLVVHGMNIPTKSPGGLDILSATKF